ncbi:MAG: hypothetical protein HY849_02030 [Nitrosomonadales bacterium]|nr:hypothetical protein [Nitrosomonadales bacterium]
MIESVAKYLATKRPRRGNQKLLAEQLGVTTRTLRNWRAAAVRIGPPRPPGRPRRATALVRRARWIVARIWWRLPRPCDGARTVEEELERRGVELSTALVQELVSALKERRARTHRRRIERERASVDVKLRDAMWSVDDTPLGRDVQGGAHGIVVRETATPKTLWTSVGPPPTGEELVRILEATAEERGCWPLVMSFDRGSANRASIVRECLESHGVILLFNVPHTPEHNTFVEHAIGDLQCAGGLDAKSELPVDELPSSRDDLAQRLERARERLNNTPRRSLGGKTPDEIDRLTPRAEDRVCRESFYQDTRAALAKVAEQPLRARDRYRAEREAILCKLAEHGLVDRTTGGGRSSRPSKRKEFL